METVPIIWKKVIAHTPIEMQSLSLPKAEMFLTQDPRWLETLISEDKSKYVVQFIQEQSNEEIGWATFFVHPSALSIALSDWTLYAHPIRRFTLFVPPLLQSSSNMNETERLQALFTQLHSQLEINEALFFESVEADSLLDNLLTKNALIQKQFHILEYGERYLHRHIDFSGNYDDYLKQLSAKTRSDLKRTRKRFIAQTSAYHFQCYKDPSEISAFLDAAISVSKRTYQHQLLGAGLRDRESLMQRYLITANLGWFRSYVLFAEQQPIAFQVGYLHNGCYHAREIGYDPDWVKLQVGIFLHTEIIQDLLTASLSIKSFDFGNDDNLHKQRLSNAAKSERYVYVIPRHWRNNLLVPVIRFSNWLSINIGRLFKYFGLRERIRKLLWKLGVKKK